MADFSALRRTHTTGFTIGPRGHVVVVHVTLLGGWGDGVDHLVHAWHGQGDDVHYLCFTALEQSGAMCGGQQAHFRRHWAKIAWSATVDAHVLADHALTHEVLGE